MSETRLLLIALSALLGGSALAALAAHGPAADHRVHDHLQHTPASGAASRPRASTWTTLPMLVAGRTPPGDRSLARFVPINLQAAAVVVYAPHANAAGARIEIPTGTEGAKFRAPKGRGNYYWVCAHEQRQGVVVTASTVRYFSNPGPAPTELLKRSKGELEVVPQPLPREHAYYRAGEQWPFLVRYRGQPLAGATVRLETEHGTHATFTTDERGLARVAFPLDFKNKGPSAERGHAGHGPPRAAFVLAVEHRDGNRRYLTAFNYVYTPDAYAQKSLWAGLGFALFGMALALPLLRRRKKDA